MTVPAAEGDRQTSAEVGGVTPAPSMLDLVRLSRRPLFPPGGQAIYRQIALLTGMRAEQEVLDVACGAGVTLSYFVEEFGVQGFGVDFDQQLVEQAEARARESELRGRLQFQQAPLDRLPYRDEIFDVVVGELGLAAHAEPEDAVRELVRVTRPGGRIVLIQLVWKAPVDPDRRRILTRHLGAHPLMLVEWKRLLRETGVDNLHTEAWSDEETAFRPQVKKPFPDFAELFTLPEKLGILRRAWGRWGWSGVRTAVAREVEVHRLLTRERILGLDLVIGTKSGTSTEDGEAPETDAAQETEADVALETETDAAHETEADATRETEADGAHKTGAHTVHQTEADAAHEPEADAAHGAEADAAREAEADDAAREAEVEAGGGKDGSASTESEGRGEGPRP